MLQLVKEAGVKFDYRIGYGDANPKLTGRWKIETQGDRVTLFLEVEVDVLPTGFIKFWKHVFTNHLDRATVWVNEKYIMFVPAIYEQINDCNTK